MGDLAQQIDRAKANLESLERQAAAATCDALGRHDWQSTGGCWAACCADCSCSVPVHQCARCGEQDYGENAAAIEVIQECAERRG